MFIVLPAGGPRVGPRGLQVPAEGQGTVVHLSWCLGAEVTQPSCNHVAIGKFRFKIQHKKIVQDTGPAQMQCSTLAGIVH